MRHLQIGEAEVVCKRFLHGSFMFLSVNIDSENYGIAKKDQVTTGMYVHILNY